MIEVRGLVVIGRGRLIADATTQDILRGLGHLHSRVRSSQPDALSDELCTRGFTVQRVDTHELHAENSLLRNTAAALVSVLLLMLVLPLLLPQFGYGSMSTLADLLPGTAVVFLLLGSLRLLRDDATR